MWCKARLESCMVTVTQNQRLYNFMKTNRCSMYRGYGTLR